MPGPKLNFLLWPSLALLMILGCESSSPSQNGDPAAPAEESVLPNSGPVSLLGALQPLPHRRHGHRLETFGSGNDLQLLAFGGFGSSRKGVSESWVFRRSEDSWRWQRGPDLSRGRSFAESFQANGRIYSVAEDWEWFDNTRQTWNPGALDSRLPRSHFAGTFWNGAFYSLGGFPKEQSDFVRCYLDGSCEKLPNPPGFGEGHHLHVMELLDDRLSIFNWSFFNRFDVSQLDFIWRQSNGHLELSRPTIFGTDRQLVRFTCIHFDRQRVKSIQTVGFSCRDHFASAILDHEIR